MGTKLALALSSTIVFCVLTSSASTEDKVPASIDYAQAMTTMTELVGGGVETGTTNGQCVVSITVDRGKVNRDFQKLQTIGLLNPDISQTFINTHQNPAALAMATQLTVMAIISKYRTTAMDKCAFVASFLITDEYGQEKKQVLFGFGFDRKLFNKINWENFENSNLPKVSYQYQMSSWASAHFMD